jgi:hypothetical protein
MAIIWKNHLLPIIIESDKMSKNREISQKVAKSRDEDDMKGGKHTGK